MKNFLCIAFVLFSITSVLAEPLQIGNSTPHTIRVRVPYNDGAGCDVVLWKTLCIGPWSSGVIENTDLPDPALKPFAIRVWTNCAPDPATESWAINPYLGCAGPSSFPTYTMEWWEFPDVWGGSIWGVTITLT